MPIELQLPKERNIIFNTQVDQKTIGDLTKEIISINENDKLLKKIYEVYNLDYNPKPIKIFIDSYGGAVYQCFGLLSIMENSKTPIHTIATGAAMSCGFMILISGNKRFAYQNATPMYHQVSHGSHGKLKEMQETIMEAERLQKMIENMTIKKTKITKKQLEKVHKSKEDWFMTSDEALKYGVIDEIL